MGSGGHSSGLSSVKSPTRADGQWNGALATFREDPPSSSASSADLPTPLPNPGHFSYKDPRHRVTASIAYAGGPTRERRTLNPVAIARLVYSNLRRSSLNDILYGLVFVTTVLIFFSALAGAGHSAPDDGAVGSSTPTQRVPEKQNPGPREWPVLRDVVQTTVDVNVPKAYLPVEEDDEAPPADVHQAHGDSSHDYGDDLMHASPSDPRLDDDQTHEVQRRRGKAALFANHDAPEDASAQTHTVTGMDEELEEDEDDDEEEEDEPRLAAARDAEAEESFLAHPPPGTLHIIDQDDNEPARKYLRPDPPKPRAPPPVVVVEEVEERSAAVEEEGEADVEPEVDVDAQRKGDALRRPAGREGIEQIQAERANLGRERAEWAAAAEAGRGEGRGRRMKEVR